MTINLKPTDQGPQIHTDIPMEWGEEIRPLNIPVFSNIIELFI